ncbi:MAG: mechanosensitive ion channel family protein [Candidatus Delongbacteria bacterium]|nr:mechanosensitive ion channel family protein [Candidatus Delongbacteria bacterium]MBN2835333.1 mechanosensitive ion channel family protein [Candidatus Delongbacteria bacterium]
MHKYMEIEYWEKVWSNFNKWLEEDLLRIIIITLVLFITLKLINFIFNRLKRILLSNLVLNRVQGREESEKRITTLIKILKYIVKVIVYITFITHLLKLFGVDLGPVVASAGIAGLAIGFGAQELVKDFISGFFMLLENQIRVGDYVIINDTYGEVERIEMRTTTIRDFNGNVHVFQNSKISTLSNMTKEWSASILEIGVSYDSDIELVMKLLNEVGKEIEQDEVFSKKILTTPEVLGLDKFADSSLNFKIRIKVKPMTQWEVAREFRKRVKYKFDKNGIEIPFPHRTVYIRNEKKDTGDI